MELYKQKAIEILEKIKPNTFGWSLSGGYSKECLLIASNQVDDILTETKRLDDKFNLGLEGTTQFWNSVKFEITNNIKIS